MRKVVGVRVSYGDMANPRKFGEITERRESEWGLDFKVEWEDGGSTVSDLRQAGWREEPPKL